MNFFTSQETTTTKQVSQNLHNHFIIDPTLFTKLCFMNFTILFTQLINTTNNINTTKKGTIPKFVIKLQYEYDTPQPALS